MLRKRLSGVHLEARLTQSAANLVSLEFASLPNSGNLNIQLLHFKSNIAQEACLVDFFKLALD